MVVDLFRGTNFIDFHHIHVLMVGMPWKGRGFRLVKILGIAILAREQNTKVNVLKTLYYYFYSLSLY